MLSMHALSDVVPLHTQCATAPIPHIPGTALRHISLECACACPLGRCVTVCLPFSPSFTLPSFTNGRQGRRCFGCSFSRADFTMLLHTHQVAEWACLQQCYCPPLTRFACRCCPCYCTPVLQTGPPTHIAFWNAFAISYPCRKWACLPILALHVNVYALITPPPWSIPRLSQLPLQRRPSVITLAAHSSTSSSFPQCVRFWLARMPKKAHSGRTFLDLSVPADRSLSASILANHGWVHYGKFGQLHDKYRILAGAP